MAYQSRVTAARAAAAFAGQARAYLPCVACLPASSLPTCERCKPALQVLTALARCRRSKLRVLLRGRSRSFRQLPAAALFHPSESIPQQALAYLRRKGLCLMPMHFLEHILAWPASPPAALACILPSSTPPSARHTLSLTLSNPVAAYLVLPNCPSSHCSLAPPHPTHSHFHGKQQYKRYLVHTEPPGRCILLRRLKGGADSGRRRAAAVARTAGCLWEAGEAVGEVVTERWMRLKVRSGGSGRRQAVVPHLPKLTCTCHWVAPLTNAVWVERAALVHEGILLSRRQVTDHYTSRLSAGLAAARHDGSSERRH